MIITLIISHIAAFVLGALVFRNNRGRIEGDAAKVEQAGKDLK